jgi:hypothetical protein
MSKKLFYPTFHPKVTNNRINNEIHQKKKKDKQMKILKQGKISLDYPRVLDPISLGVSVVRVLSQRIIARQWLSFWP